MRDKTAKVLTNLLFTLSTGGVGQILTTTAKTMMKGQIKQGVAQLTTTANKQILKREGMNAALNTAEDFDDTDQDDNKMANIGMIAAFQKNKQH